MKGVGIACLFGLAFLLSMCEAVKQQRRNLPELDNRADAIRKYAQKKGYSTSYCFLIDMRKHSGLNRFFVYDLNKNAVVFSGLVAHGSCDEYFLKQARFSNTPGCGCTSIGIYKVGYAYHGEYGKAYKLYGLENSNSNAFRRGIVLHAYRAVPDEECYPKSIYNSSGCPIVSVMFLRKLSSILDKSNKSVLLWVFNAPFHRNAGFLFPETAAQRYSFN
jgi:hypothetical protein